MLRKILAALMLLFILLPVAEAAQKKDKKGKKGAETSDPYAQYVWPPLPDKPRIKLETVISGRKDVEGESKWKKILIGMSPESSYDNLKKPFAVEYDNEGRVLVSEPDLKAILRFDRTEAKMDVLGTRGAITLVTPMGLEVGPDGSLYVADIGRRQVLGFNSEGSIIKTFGGGDTLTNPTDVAVPTAGTQIYVADSKQHKIVVFDLATGEVVNTFGSRGESEGQFGFPTSLTFGIEGNLHVVDQLNSRVQVFTADGEYLDHFGARAVGFGGFVRPKDIAIDDVGLIFVSDFAFNNIQIFDLDFSLLTFVGQGGTGPGQFNGVSGIATYGDEFAVVDQLGKRLQIFRFIASKGEE